MLEYIDGTFSAPQHLENALQKFLDEVPTGQVKSLHVGSLGSLDDLKNKRMNQEVLDSRLTDLEDMVKGLVRKHNTSLYVPTPSEIASIVKQHNI